MKEIIEELLSETAERPVAEIAFVRDWSGATTCIIDLERSTGQRRRAFVQKGNDAEEALQKASDEYKEWRGDVRVRTT
jgi:hypothetical protein